jgi:hypothetical protein
MKMTTLITIAGLALAVLRQMATAAAAGVNVETQLALASSPSGRIALHLVCVWRDHRLQWHWRGVAREFAHV